MRAKPRQPSRRSVRRAALVAGRRGAEQRVAACAAREALKFFARADAGQEAASREGIAALGSSCQW